MHQAPAISRSSFSRTLGAAGWLLGLVAVGEVIVGGSALVERARHNPAVSIRVPPDGLEGGAEDRPTPNFVDPFASSATSSPPKLIATAPKPQAPPAATPMQVASLPQPTPVPEKLVSLPESRLDALIAEARALRQRGDTSTAITRLREALTMSPKSPLVMTELATTFEKMGLEDKALEQYHNVYDLGDSAGIYYELADAKIKAAQAPSPAVAQTSPGATSGAPAHDDVGFQPGSSLALVSLSTVEKPDTVDGYKQFTLKIPVKRRPDTKINVSGVVIQVFFYDQLGNGNIVRTNANVSSKWSSLPADWVGNDIEILDVDYTQAPPEPGKIEEGRHYYGYIVCVYYNKDLQDQAADPDDLIKQYPPPLTLPDQ